MVRKVVGEIGGSGDWTLENGVLTLQWWDDDRKQVIPAQVDEVAVLPTAEDWAVAAVVEKLSNISWTSNFTVDVREGTKLSSNTRRILREHA